jgi:hypothetical protein
LSDRLGSSCCLCLLSCGCLFFCLGVVLSCGCLALSCSCLGVCFVLSCGCLWSCLMVVLSCLLGDLPYFWLFFSCPLVVLWLSCCLVLWLSCGCLLPYPGVAVSRRCLVVFVVVLSCRYLVLRLSCRGGGLSCLMVCRVVSCRVVSCRVVSCRVVSCRVLSCHVVVLWFFLSCDGLALSCLCRVGVVLLVRC